MAGDANPYRYVGNNPMTFTDPSGLFKFGNVALDRAVSYWSGARAQNRLKYSATIIGSAMLNAGDTLTLNKIDSLHKLASQSDMAIAHSRRKACLEGTWNAKLTEDVIQPVLEESMTWLGAELAFAGMGRGISLGGRIPGVARIGGLLETIPHIRSAATVVKYGGALAGIGLLANSAIQNIGGGIKQIQNGDTWGGAQSIIRGGFRAAQAGRVFHAASKSLTPRNRPVQNITHDELVRNWRKNNSAFGQETPIRTSTASPTLEDAGTLFRRGEFADPATGWKGNYVKGLDWSQQNPLTTPGYVNRLGLPLGNSNPMPDWIVGGRINPGAGAVSYGAAPGIGGNFGGAPEFTFSPNDIALEWFHMP